MQVVGRRRLDHHAEVHLAAAHAVEHVLLDAVEQHEARCPGSRRAQAAMQAGIRLADSVGLLATRTLPRRALGHAGDFGQRLVELVEHAVEPRASDRPASVSTTSRVVRSSSCRPSCASSSTMERLTAGCVRPIWSPARLKLRPSATAWKTRSWRRVTFMQSKSYIHRINPFLF